MTLYLISKYVITYVKAWKEITYLGKISALM